MIRRVLPLPALAVTAFLLLPAGNTWGATGPVPGTSVIGPGGTLTCLTALDGHRSAGTPVVLSKCAQRPAQQWNVNTVTGEWRLHGTKEYVTVPTSSTTLTLVLGPKAAAAQFVYVNHRVAADGDWLTHKAGDRYPFLQNPIGRGQTWYIFTTLCCERP